MYRNQYDTDVVTWSPQGRVFQIEYAMEAVKQGTAVVGARNNEMVVLVCIKRSTSKLAGYQKKLYKIDNHIGAAVSGITADAKVLCNYLRSECLNHSFTYDSPIPLNTLINKLVLKSQLNTQEYGRRPFGVGLLLAGCDESGPHLFETCPSGNCFEYYSIAIGSRSQASKTYLEKHFEEFANCNKDQLILHALRALRSSLSSEQEMNQENVDVAILGKNYIYNELLEEEKVKYLQIINQEQPPVIEQIDESQAASSMQMD
ncbi:proteasome subunit alpha type 1 [Cryptosporidium sp. chipmunk genotype I]|uniref:proteasome subunit alpha type 1 n=1 Tax=Cryptosporidium sp. chipmunk genotype I TaxID=1280935 RepID=UPI003519F348|nr:proteasome subunit alpha type 1 [Cryptosporidium sp. chipmunk genotype I]